MAEAKRQNYLHGAAIMTAGVIVVKVLGALFKIPLGSMKLLGDEGFSNFISAYNIYTLFLTLSTAGFPVALSRMISEADTLGRKGEVQRIFRVALVFLAALGGAACLVMMLFPDALAYRLGDVQAMQGIFVLGPAALLVCVLSVYRGYCQGHGNMTPTTVSQILEVAVKVPVGLALAWYLVRSGRGLPVASAGAIFGVLAGSAVALIYMVRYTARHYDLSGSGGESRSSGAIFADLLRIGVPITLGGCVIAVINLVDNAQILNRLQDAAGCTAGEARVLYGIYGKVQNLYMLPSYFMTPFQASVIPAIVSCLALKKQGEASAIAESALRTATVVVLPMCVGLSVMAYPIVNVLWPGSNAAGPGLLRYLGAAAFFVCMTMLTNALLQSTGRERLPMVSMACGGVVKVVMNHVLIGDPAVNIHGAAISAVACFAVMAAMNYLFLRRSLSHPPRLSRFLLRPLLSSAVMGVGAWAVYGLLSGLLGGGRFPMLAAMGGGIVCAVVIYVVMAVLTRSVTAEDLRLLPGGEKLAAKLRLR